MDSNVWPCRTSELNPHISINQKEKFLNIVKIINLYYNNNLDFMDSNVWPCHTFESPPHISINH